MRKPPSGTAILLGAAVTIDRCGFARGCLSDGNGCVCVVRALQMQVVGDSFLVPWWESGGNEMPDGYAEALHSVNTYLGWPAYWAPDRTEDALMAWNDATCESGAVASEMLRQVAYTMTPVGAGHDH